MRFHDRREAGRKLAEVLQFLKGRPDVWVLAIPRGGVVVAYQVAQALGLPLDVMITRKVGAPGNPEFALGAIAGDGTVVLDEFLIAELGIPEDWVLDEMRIQQEEIQRRLRRYRGDRPMPEIEGRTVVLIDDGVATGSTVLASLRALRKRQPAKLILAIPVGPPETVAQLGREADQVICLMTPEPFWAVGRFYQVFDQTTDEEVVELLEAAWDAAPNGPAAQSSG
jgi:predicted phosphoribosyltransferase